MTIANTRISFAIENAEILEIDNSHFATAKIEAFSSGWNLHKTNVTVETLQRVSYTIEEKPIVFEMEGADFGQHSNITVPAGFVSPGSVHFIDREDGRKTLVVEAKIWKRYSGKFLEVFRNSKDGKDVSVEIVLIDPDFFNSKSKSSASR